MTAVFAAGDHADDDFVGGAALSANGLRSGQDIARGQGTADVVRAVAVAADDGGKVLGAFAADADDFR